MKRNVKKILQLSAGTAIAVIITSFSIACSNEDDNLDLQLIEKQNEQKEVLNEETAEFKSNLLSVLKQEKKKGYGNDFSFSEENVAYLKEKGLKMFKSHGFTEDNLKSAGAKTDEDIIAMATIFTAIMEHPADIPRVMKRNESNEPCYDSNAIADCILQATGIKAFVTGCLTKAAALKLVAKIVPYVGAAVMIADFANCMGWFD